MFSSAVIFASVLILTIGFCTLADGFASDLEENLRQLQENVNAIDENKMRKEMAVKKKLLGFIQFHSDARQLVPTFF